MVSLCLFCLIVILRGDQCFAKRRTTHYLCNLLPSVFYFYFQECSADKPGSLGTEKRIPREKNVI